MRTILGPLIASSVLPAPGLASAQEGYGYGPHMMWWGGGWFGMIFGPVLMIVGLAVAIALALVLGRWLGGAAGPGTPSTS
jgi:putative membrane protein